MAQMNFTIDYIKENCNSKEEVETFCNALILRGYVPFSEKLAMAKTLINSALRQKGSGFIENDSPKKYFLFQISIIALYVKNITLETKFSDEGYDVLKSRGIIDYVIDSTKADITEYTNIFNMVFDDIMNNERSANAIVYNLVNGIIPYLERNSGEIFPVEKETDDD